MSQLEAYNLSISGADGKNEWSLTFTPSQCLHGTDGGDVIASVLLVMQYAVCLLGCKKLIFLFPWPNGPLWARAPCGPGPPRHRGFTITLRHTTLGRTPLGE
jgi:hypothetical protein